MDNPTITAKVKENYWQYNHNCATTTLRIFAEHTAIELSPEVFAAAVGMHGAGGYGAQCGLVEGALMFLGILGRRQQLSDQEIARLCHRYGADFTATFSSLLCRELRPEGFHDEQEPHLCQELTCRAIAFGIDFLERFLMVEDSEATSRQQSPTTGERR